LSEVADIAKIILAEPAVEGGASPSISTGDARALSIDTASVDVVVSSPPYCTRIDYAVKTRLELDILGSFVERSFASFRKDLMGTTSLRERARVQNKPALPDDIQHVLRQVESHDSHRAAEYYYPGLLQYFSDAQSSIGEIARVLKPRGVAFLVVQNSFFKEVPIPLPEMYISLGEQAGLSGTVVSRVPIEPHRNKASVNRAVRGYTNRSYYEALVRMENANV